MRSFFAGDHNGAAADGHDRETDIEQDAAVAGRGRLIVRVLRTADGAHALVIVVLAGGLDDHALALNLAAAGADHIAGVAVIAAGGVLGVHKAGSRGCPRCSWRW